MKNNGICLSKHTKLIFRLFARVLLCDWSDQMALGLRLPRVHFLHAFLTVLRWLHFDQHPSTAKSLQAKVDSRAEQAFAPGYKRRSTNAPLYHLFPAVTSACKASSARILPLLELPGGISYHRLCHMIVIQAAIHGSGSGSGAQHLTFWLYSS